MSQGTAQKRPSHLSSLALRTGGANTWRARSPWRGQAGRSENFAESLSKRADVLKSSGVEGWQVRMLTAARAISPQAGMRKEVGAGVQLQGRIRTARKVEGKSSVQGQRNHCGEWSPKAAQCPKRMNSCRAANWNTGTQNAPRAKARESTVERASSSSPSTAKRNRLQTGSGKNTSYTRKGKKSNVFTGMEEQDWSEWSGNAEVAGETLELFSHADGPTAVSLSGEPKRVNLCDIVKSTKVFTSKHRDKRERERAPRVMNKTGSRSGVGCPMTKRSARRSRRM